MKIEVRNLKIFASLSEETTAYTADIFVDGVKTFAAYNHGHGACDDYRRLPTAKVTEADVNAWLADNCPPDGPWQDNPAERAPYDTGTTCNLETFVGRILGRAESEKEGKRIRKLFDRKMAERICALNAKGDFVVFGKAVHKPTTANLAAVRSRNPTVTVLNDADDATKARGLAAFCPNLGEGAGETDEQLEAAVLARYEAQTLTVADARYLIVKERRAGEDADHLLIAALQSVVDEGEAAEQAYRAERDAEHATAH